MLPSSATASASGYVNSLGPLGAEAHAKSAVRGELLDPVVVEFRHEAVFRPRDRNT